MKYVPRLLENHVKRAATQFPVVWITGPRQSGKTTLARHAFPDFEYVSLEAPDTRRLAQHDPRAFIRRFAARVIIDEVQRCPDLMSYLQGHIDESGQAGQYVLTGSHQFQLSRNISQSLAGRTAVVSLLPFSLAELYSLRQGPLLASADSSGSLLPGTVPIEKVLLSGMFPAVHDRDADPATWYQGYYATYLERDIRELTAVHDLDRFDTFVRMCAARSGCVLNVSALSGDTGVSVTTARNWLTLLQTSGIAMLLNPHFENFSKRLTKAPKLHFLDPGLLCYLLRIQVDSQVSLHPLRGQIFESFVVSEIVKSFSHAGREPPVYYWRDNKGREIDVVLDTAEGLCAVEVKSAETFDPSFAQTLRWWKGIAGDSARVAAVVYGGNQEFETGGIVARSWRRAF
jgi:predicted AAA+ superfamily ATPase